MAKKSKAVKVSSSESESVTPRLQELYSNTVRPALAEELSRKNPHSIPKLEKIVVNKENRKQFSLIYEKEPFLFIS